MIILILSIFGKIAHYTSYSEEYFDYYALKADNMPLRLIMIISLFILLIISILNIMNIFKINKILYSIIIFIILTEAILANILTIIMNGVYQPLCYILIVFLIILLIFTIIYLIKERKDE